MSIYWKIIFIVSFGLFSCTHELEIIEVPKDLIPPEQFQPVLKDIMYLESHTRTQFNNVNDFYKILPKSANVIFESHGIDSLRYYNSMQYYVKKQELLIEMYQAILDEIQEKDSLQEIKAPA